MIKDFPLLFKRTKTGAIQTWRITQSDGTFFTNEGQQGGKITTSKPTKCKAKNIGKANETTAETQALKEAIAKHNKKLKMGYTPNLHNVDTVDRFYEPMLAKSYHEYIDEVKKHFPVYVQPKLDGIRNVTNHVGGRTRNGELIHSIPHILNTLKPFFVEHVRAVLDGELYNHVYHDNFNKIQSLVTKKKTSVLDVMEIGEVVQYHVYDIPCFGNFDETDKFSDRYYAFKKYYDSHPEIHDCIKLVETFKANSVEEIDALYDKFIEQGYEGAIVRIDAKYHNKRSKDLLKYKRFVDEDYVILDVLEGKGNKAGMAAKMTFRAESGNLFNASVKGPHEYLKTILADRDELIGKIGTVKYFNLTPDKQVPRFGYVIKVDRRDII